MQLLNNTFDSFSSANYVIAQLNRAINTSYIPSGDNIQEVISNFTKIQLQRSFNPSCYGSANLGMQFDENAVLINYSSTSGTTVCIEYKFDCDMQVESIDIGVWIPDDRAQSGRCHYEILTQELYHNDFLNVDWTAKTAEIVTPSDMVKLNNDWSVSDNIPNWVDEQKSNFISYFNPDNTAAELLELGYVPVDQPIGYTAVWYSPTNYYSYVVLYERLHPVDNNYYLLHDAGSKLSREGGVSYKRLLEIIKSATDKQERRSRRSQITENEIEYDENEIEVDYEYDENEIDFTDDNVGLTIQPRQFVIN